MMYSIEILAAFDFLGKETKVGTLEYERVKGNASYRFFYDKAFLSAFPKVNLSTDIGRFLGVQAASGNLFSFLGDAFPATRASCSEESYTTSLSATMTTTSATMASCSARMAGNSPRHTTSIQPSKKRRCLPYLPTRTSPPSGNSTTLPITIC